MPLTNKRPFITVLSLAVLFFSISCGTSGGSGLHIKSTAAGEKDVAAKSSYAFVVTKSFTDISGKLSTASAYNVYVANYDLDSANFAMTLDKPVTSEEQVRVVFSLIGAEGTNDKSPLKAGTYSAKAEKFMKVETVGIVARKGGGENKAWFDRSLLTGEVKVTS